MNIAIIGSGHVGLITGLCLAEKGHKVLCVDHDRAKIEKLRSGKATFYEPGVEELLGRHVKSGAVTFGGDTGEAVRFAEAIFICVGTPSTPQRHVDMRFIEAVSRDIAHNLKDYRVIIEKSTVPIQTGQRVKACLQRYAAANVPFDVVSNPEFLREGDAVNTTMYPDRIILGVESERAEKVMRAVYAGFTAPMIVTSIQSAELIKHASNAFLAMRISFMNAMSRICEAGGADVEEVARGIGLDPRIGKDFLRAGIGYGGSCFPKDVDGLYHIARDLGYDCPLLKQIQDINEGQWRHFVDRIEEELWVVQGKKVAMWGLAFKPDTDDIRDAPALKIAAELMHRGARVYAYDPVANANSKAKLPDLNVCESALAAVEQADVLVVCTEWPALRKVDMREVKSRMTVPIVFDGRNYLDREAMRAMGFHYHGVGR